VKIDLLKNLSFEGEVFENKLVLHFFLKAFKKIGVVL
jgi:hypothetical protein